MICAELESSAMNLKREETPFLFIAFDLNINIPVYDNIFWSDSMGESF